MRNSKTIFLVGYMLLILVGSVIPGDRDLGGFKFTLALGPTLQNFLHVPVFALLAVLMLRAGKSRLGALVFCTGFGAFCEVIQMFVPGRFAGLEDLLLNTLGVLAGISFFHMAESCRK